MLSDICVRLTSGPAVLVVMRSSSRRIIALLELLRLGPLDANATSLVVAFKPFAPVGSPGTPPIKRVNYASCTS